MTITPETETLSPEKMSRRARLDVRRRRRVRILLGVLAVVAIGGAAAFAVFTVKDEPSKATADGGDPAIIGPSETTVPNKAPAVQKLRALTHAAPLRLWVGGDSLAGSFGPALGDLVGATGVAKTTVDYKVSSGLWAVDFRNWPQRAAQQMAGSDPEAVVFMIGTNDTPTVNSVDANSDGMPDWQVDYRAKIDQLMKTFVGTNHRTVYWLGPPTLGTESMDDGAVELSSVMREEAEKYAPDVVFVDAYKLFSTDSGEYSRRIVDENNEEFTARIGDGVHFTPAGAEYLARTLFKLIDTRWKLEKQADTKEPIAWALAEGSGENVPGYSTRPRSRYRSGSSNNNSNGNDNGNSSGNTYTTPTDAPAPTTVFVPQTDPPATVVQTVPPTPAPTTPPPPPTTPDP